MRPFEGVKILDCTHVLAGPFATYQLAVLGADVIKVEDPNEPDQSGESGGDHALNKARMGTSFLTQGSNKRSIALNLKTEAGREALKRLVRDWADVFVENYHTGKHHLRAGNRMRFAENSMHEASDGLLQIAASNPRQHRRFYTAIGESAEAERTSLDERYSRYEEKFATVAGKIKQKTADEWENYLQGKHVPATRVRELPEALQDPQLKHRGVLHRLEGVPGVGKPVTVPLAAFKFAHDGPSIERPPARLGEHTDAVLASVGYSAAEIAALHAAEAAG